VSLLFAAALVGAPMVGAKVLIWWIGLWAVAFGALFVFLAFKLRAAQARLRG